MQITNNELSGYTLGKTLGKGTFGKVKLATHKVTNQPVAIKILDVTDVERVSRELHILKITQHSAIAQMYQIVQTAEFIFIVMEYAPLGQFFDYIMDGKVKNQSEAHYFFVQIVSALEYLHRLKISHRDVKPENMLLDQNRRLKIVDFGLSNMYKDNQLLLTACGSPCYASPEMIKGQQYDPQLTDVWSLGVVLFSMIFAKLPFQDDNTTVLYGKIKSGLYVIDKKISPQLRDLLSKLLSVKPKSRYNLMQIKQHAWFKTQKPTKCNGLMVGFQNAPLDQGILQKMQKLQYNPHQARRYLQNNIRNSVTTAYYLLMKKKFNQGNPSPYDICNQNFSKKSLIPKLSKINNVQLAKTRHHSLDFNFSSPTNKQTLKVQDSIDVLRKYNTKRIQILEKAAKKQRNCHSQMKSAEYDNLQARLTVYRTQQPVLFKSLYKQKNSNSSSKTKQITELPGKRKKSEIFDKTIFDKRRSVYKNLQKQQNISINVYINNTKISTPKQKKTRISNSKIEKGIFQVRNQNNLITSLKFSDKSSNKRIKTQFIDREKSDVKTSKRYETDKSQTQSKSLQKYNDIQIDNTFWKKRSNNSKVRDLTTDCRKEQPTRIPKW